MKLKKLLVAPVVLAVALVVSGCFPMLSKDDIANLENKKFTVTRVSFKYLTSNVDASPEFKSESFLRKIVVGNFPFREMASMMKEAYGITLDYSGITSKAQFDGGSKGLTSTGGALEITSDASNTVAIDVIVEGRDTRGGSGRGITYQYFFYIKVNDGKKTKQMFISSSAPDDGAYSVSIDLPFTAKKWKKAMYNTVLETYSDANRIMLQRLKSNL
jgi:hypothetical protein